MPGGGRRALRRAGIAMGALGGALLLGVLPATSALAAPQPPIELRPPVDVSGAIAPSFPSTVRIALSPDGARTYALNIDDSQLHIIDTATNTPADPPIPVSLSFASYFGPAPIVHPDGRVFILDPGVDLSAGAGFPTGILIPTEIFEIDPASRSVFRHELDVPAPWSDPVGVSMALTTDGSKAYIADPQNGVVLVADIPPSAAAAPVWPVTAIDVTGATTPQILPGGLAIAGDRLYVLDLLGEDGPTSTGVAVIRVADDALEPTVIGYTAPPGTTGGILPLPMIEATPDGRTVLISAAAELDDGSGDFSSFFWTIPGGTVPATASYLGPGLGESLSLSFSPTSDTVYVLDCACFGDAWTLDLATGAGSVLDLGGATGLDILTSIAVSPDGTRLLLGGSDAGDRARVWQLGTTADDELALSAPGSATQGDSVAITVAGADNSGNPVDLTGLVEFSSSVPTDTFADNVVTFHSASPHTITATYQPTSGGPAFAVGSTTIEVAAVIPPTGPQDPTPAFMTASAMLVLGALLAVGAARVRRSG